MRFNNHNLKNNMAKDTEGVVTVVRDDGKEFVINRNILAEHINRGFVVKSKADQPTEDELKAAVGYKGSAASQTAPTKAAAAPAGDTAPAAGDTAPEKTDGEDPSEADDGETAHVAAPAKSASKKAAKKAAKKAVTKAVTKA